MEYVDFFADDGKGGTLEWWETNYGQLRGAIAKLVGEPIAENLVSILRTNEVIRIPANTLWTRSTPFNR